MRRPASPPVRHSIRVPFKVIERVHLAELAKAETLPTDDERDEKRRRRVESTYDEMFEQPSAMNDHPPVRARVDSKRGGNGRRPIVTSGLPRRLR
jgi:hypothetical protein